MKLLVTGGAGFIGSHLVEALLARGEWVRVLDDFSTGKRGNLAPFLDRVELIEGDIRDYDVVRRAAHGMDLILHQAALASVPRSIRQPLASHEVNVTGTLHVLQAAREEGVGRIVYASSSSVYGDSPVLPKREDMTPDPLSPYAASKLAGEHYCQVFSRVYGLETVPLRYFNVFGPRQDPESQYAAVIPKFIKAMLRGESPVIYGDGEQSRDFTYVANVVEANLLAAAAPTADGAPINCACHTRITLNELVAHLNEILGTHAAPIYTDPRPGDVKHSFADLARARERLGYEPVVGFEEGLRCTVEAMRGAA
ncbi:MAG: SDR family oxidoreductase [Chloroflexi bacterium]|nr:SDR family oxidoreductase [Chloroflexota bacterium]